MNIDRLIAILGGAAAAAVLLLMLINAVSDPLAGRRAWLEDELARVPAEPQNMPSGYANYEQWRSAVTGREAVWQALVEPPPVLPPPPPEKKCDPISKFLEGVSAGRAQVGKRVRIFTPDNQRGEFLGVGDTVNGCTIEEVSKTEVIFTRHCPEKDVLLRAAIVRE